MGNVGMVNDRKPHYPGNVKKPDRKIY